MTEPVGVGLPFGTIVQDGHGKHPDDGIQEGGVENGIRAGTRAELFTVCRLELLLHLVARGNGAKEAAGGHAGDVEENLRGIGSLVKAGPEAIDAIMENNLVAVGLGVERVRREDGQIGIAEDLVQLFRGKILESDRIAGIVNVGVDIAEMVSERIHFLSPQIAETVPLTTDVHFVHGVGVDGDDAPDTRAGEHLGATVHAAGTGDDNLGAGDEGAIDSVFDTAAVKGRKGGEEGCFVFHDMNLIDKLTGGTGTEIGTACIPEVLASSDAATRTGMTLDDGGRCLHFLLPGGDHGDGIDDRNLLFLLPGGDHSDGIDDRGLLQHFVSDGNGIGLGSSEHIGEDAEASVRVGENDGSHEILAGHIGEHLAEVLDVRPGRVATAVGMGVGDADDRELPLLPGLLDEGIKIGGIERVGDGRRAGPLVEDDVVDDDPVRIQLVLLAQQKASALGGQAADGRPEPVLGEGGEVNSGDLTSGSIGGGMTRDCRAGISGADIGVSGSAHRFIV